MAICLAGSTYAFVFNAKLCTCCGQLVNHCLDCIQVPKEYSYNIHD